jgi:hypothetical protein
MDPHHITRHGRSSAPVAICHDYDVQVVTYILDHYRIIFVLNFSRKFENYLNFARFFSQLQNLTKPTCANQGALRELFVNDTTIGPDSRHAP